MLVRPGALKGSGNFGRRPPSDLAEFAGFPVSHGYVTTGREGLDPLLYQMMLNEVRDLEALKLNAAGISVGIPADTPPILGGAGHDVFRSLTNRLINSDQPQAGTNGWSANQAGTVITADATTLRGRPASRVQLSGASASNIMARQGMNISAPTAGRVFAGKFTIRNNGGATTGRLRILVSGGASPNVPTDNDFTIPAGVSDIYVVTPAIVANDRTTVDISMRAAATGSYDFFINDFMLDEIPLGAFPYVSSGATPVTRNASISTVINQPALGDFRVKLREDIPDLSNRTFWSRGPDANNKSELAMIDGKIRQTITVGGVDVVTNETTAFGAAPGLVTIDANFADADQWLDVPGVTNPTPTTTAVSVPTGIPRFGRIGGNPAVAADWPNCTNMDYAVGPA
jgi:hypothetical protein